MPPRPERVNIIEVLASLPGASPEIRAMAGELDDLLDPNDIGWEVD